MALALAGLVKMSVLDFGDLLPEILTIFPLTHIKAKRGQTASEASLIVASLPQVQVDQTSLFFPIGHL